MGKGLGITALVIVLISFPIPVLGTWIGYLALVIAAVSALCGHKTLVIATAAIAAIKMYALSPGLMATMYAPFIKVNGESAPLAAFGFLFLTSFFAGLPIAMLLFRGTFVKLLGNIGVKVPTAATPHQDHLT